MFWLFPTLSVRYIRVYNYSSTVVKLLGKRWWIPAGARIEGPKLEPEGLKAEVGFPTADQM